MYINTIKVFLYNIENNLKKKKERKESKELIKS